MMDTEYISSIGFDGRDVEKFIERAANKNIRHRYSYEDFMGDDDLQLTIAHLKMDPDKFWSLLLFAYDYSDDVCNHGIEVEAGGHEMMWKLIDRGRALISGQKPEPIKTDAYLKFRIQGKTYTLKDVDSLSILLYWIHRGMIQMSPNDSIWALNWLIDDFESHERTRQESMSVRIWCFARLLLDFFDANPQFKGRAPKGSGISLNKQLLASKMVYSFSLSDNESFLISDETLKGFMRQYKNKQMPKRGRIYGGIKDETDFYSIGML